MTARSARLGLVPRAVLVLCLSPQFLATEPGFTGRPAVAAANSSPSANWQKQIVSLIERNRQYPGAAQCRHEEGTAQLFFSIDREGRLISSRIVTSSGFPGLDREALAIVGRAQPFPSPPREVAGTEVEFTVPIRFDMSGPNATQRTQYLTVKPDLTLMLGGEPVARELLGSALDKAAKGDKQARIMVCADEAIPDGEARQVMELVEAAGFSKAVLVRFDRVPGS